MNYYFASLSFVIIIFLIYCKGYGYYIVNPWRPRQDEVVRRMLEAGLIPKWMERTWYRMKEEYQEELKKTGDEGIKFEFKPLISAITLDDFQVCLAGLYCSYYIKLRYNNKTHT